MDSRNHLKIPGWVCVAALLANALLPYESSGQASSNVIVSHWDVRDGLPQASVTDIAQDRDGFLWLATFGGLARFDGNEFRIFDLANTPGLDYNRFVRVQIGQAGIMSVLWQGDGFSQFDGTTFRSYGFQAEADRPLSQIVAVAADSAGLWLVAHNTIGRWQEGRMTVTELEDNLIGPVHAAVDSAGTLWIGDARGLYRFADGSAEDAPRFRGTVNSLRVDHRGRVLLGTPSGLLRLEGDRTETLSAGPVGLVALGPGGLMAFVETDGWTLGLLVEDDEGRHIGRFDIPSPPSVGLRAVYLDRQSNAWFGTDGMGLYRVRYSPMERYGAAQGLGLDGVTALAEDGEGGVLVADGSGACGGVWRITPERIAKVSEACGTMVSDRDRGVWIANSGRIGLLRDGEMAEFEYGPGPAFRANQAILDRNGRIWIATGGGLVRFDSVASSLYTEQDGLASRNVRTVAEAPDAALWVGTGAGISRFADGVFTNYDEADGLSPGIARALHWDSDGVLWIGTYGGGLSRFENETFTRFSMADGLPDDVVSAIVGDDHDNLWMNSNRGVFAVARADLNAFARGEIDLITPTHVYGLGAGVQEGNGNASLKTADGRIWFPTIDGVVVVDPTEGPGVLDPPPVLIDDVRIGGRTYGASGGIEARPGSGDLEIDFTAVELVQPRALRFRYQLDGVDDEWVNAGARRVAFYTDVPPGRRAFRVQVSQPSGGWSEAAQVSLFLRPYFYQTKWFGGLVVALVVFGLYRWHGSRLAGVSRHRDELRESESRFRGASDGSLDAFFLFESVRDSTGAIDDLVFIDLNKRGEAFFGMRREQLVGHRITEILPDIRARGYLAKCIRVVETGEPFEEQRQPHSEVITARWMRLQVVRVGDGLAITARDLTDEKRTASEREQLQVQLTQSQKLEAIGMLAGGVAHDFNNILTVVAGNAELIGAMLPEDSPGTKNVRGVLEAAERGAQLTQQLLTFSRKQVSAPRLIDPSTRVLALDQMIRRLLGADIELVTLPGDNVGSIWMDPNQLEQVLLNLVVNARDAMPAGGKLTLASNTVELGANEDTDSSAIPGRYVAIVVRDTGTGMTPEVAEHVFEPFFTSKGAGHGTGLGLTMCKRIVEEGGGWISMESAVGVGTAFTIYLPVADGEAEDAERCADDDSHPAQAGTETLLLLEDSGELRSMMTNALREQGYRVHAAGLPSEAHAAIARDHEIRLMIADVVLPQQSGLQVAKEVRRVRPDLKVLFISGYLGEERQEELLEAGSAFLPKPFAPSVLVRTVREVLDDVHG